MALLPDAGLLAAPNSVHDNVYVCRRARARCCFGTQEWKCDAGVTWQHGLASSPGIWFGTCDRHKGIVEAHLREVALGALIPAYMWAARGHPVPDTAPWPGETDHLVIGIRRT